MKITNSSNIGTVNHATENLQHRILDFSKYCLVITRRQREKYRARKERGTEEQWLARLARRREYDRRIDIRCSDHDYRRMPEKMVTRTTHDDL